MRATRDSFEVPALLEDGDIRLVPLAPEHDEALGAAAADGALWELWYTSVPAPGERSQWLTNALKEAAAGRCIPWVVEVAGSVVGTTRFYDLCPDIPRVAIGYTWYAASVQRSRVNTTVKRLLLTQAFESWGAVTVQFHTDRYNLRSQRAIEGLGATHEGTLRNHQRRRDGSLRDTYCYSILDREWPEVCRHLTLRLDRHR